MQECDIVAITWRGATLSQNQNQNNKRTIILGAVTSHEPQNENPIHRPLIARRDLKEGRNYHRVDSK